MVNKIKPWLLLPPQTAHDIGPFLLRTYARFKPLQTLTWRPFVWNNIEFNNPMGIAGGVDKTGASIKDWWTLGPGFIEIGTITPQAQLGNPGVVLDRDKKSQALWNRMGFPSQGVDTAVSKLRGLYQPRFTPVFANIGKNRNTPNEKAFEDYITCIHKLTPFVDAFVVNISSPNTKGLRELLKPANLKKFLDPIITANKKASESFNKSSDVENGETTPLLLKLSPDMDDDQLHQALDTSYDLGVDGWVLTNTTLDRNGVNFPEEGGVSGAPLAEKSKKALKSTVSHLGDRRTGKLLVSVGGVMTPEDVFERLDLGADLVQVYTALIYNGPFFFREVAAQANAFGLG